MDESFDNKWFREGILFLISRKHIFYNDLLLDWLVKFMEKCEWVGLPFDVVIFDRSDFLIC